MSQISFVSDMELSPLAQRLKRAELSKLARLLGFDPQTQPIKKDPNNPEIGILHLLTSWRDAQPIGSDIRGILVEQLQQDFPDEKENLLRKSHLQSMQSNV